MKTILTTFFIFSFFLTTSAQNKMTDREIKEFKGAVKTVFEDYMLTYVSNDLGKVNERVKLKESYFDKNGNLTAEIYPSYNFKNIYSIIDGYKTFKDFSVKTGKLFKDNFRSGSIGKEEPIEPPEKLVPPDDRFTLRYAYEYDSQGKVKTERHYGNNGKLLKLTTYKYDGKGRIIEEKQRDTEAITKFTHKYYKDGNLKETLTSRNSKTDSIESKGKTVFSDYNLDAQSNWTQRKKTYSSTMGDTTYTTTTLEYRTLTYY